MFTLTETGRQIEMAFGCRLCELGLSIKDMVELCLIEKPPGGPLTGEELKAALVAGARVELAYPPL